MIVRYLRAADNAELSLSAVRAALPEPPPSIPTDAWMAARGYLRIYDRLPVLGPNERHAAYVDTVAGDHVERVWSVAQDKPDEVLRAEARAAINAWRDKQEDAGFAAIGHTWDSTPRSREKLTAVVMAGQGSPLGTWTSAADADVPVTAADLLTIYTEMVTRGAQIHARQRAMKAVIETMTGQDLATFEPGWT